jgi:hypothetical protein
VHAIVLAAVQMKTVLGCHLNPVIALLVRPYLQQIRVTFKMSLASATRSQSLSVRANTDHGIFFSMRPLQWIVVMGPYRESAD